MPAAAGRGCTDCVIACVMQLQGHNMYQPACWKLMLSRYRSSGMPAMCKTHIVLEGLH